MSTTTTEVIVVGGGIIGCSIAYYLARQGIEVTLLEAGELASGTSGTGGCSLVMQSKRPGPSLTLALESAQIYEHLADELGVDLEYQKTGSLLLVEQESELPSMQAHIRSMQEAGVAARYLNMDEVRTYQPGIAPHVLGASYHAPDGRVDPVLTTHAFARMAHHHGATIQPGVVVRSLLTSGQRVTGVETDQGEMRAEKVVLATGVWTPTLMQTIGTAALPVVPRKGHILVVEGYRPVIHTQILGMNYLAQLKPETGQSQQGEQRDMGIGLSLTQSRSGRLLIGASRELVGFDAPVSAPVVEAIQQNALRFFPGLQDIVISRVATGFRPFTPDGLPILDAPPQHPGLFIATGHEGSGITLAPVTGKILAALVTATPHTWDLAPFALSRFQSRI